MFGSEESCWNYLEPACPVFNVDSWYFWLILAVVLILIFCDVSHRLAILWDRFCACLGRQSLPPSILCAHLYHGRCLSTKMDFSRSMDHTASFLRLCDLAFHAFLSSYCMHKALASCGASLTNSSNSLEVHRPIYFLQAFTISTRVVWWDDQGIYVEQRLTTDDGNSLCAVNLSHQTVNGARPQDLFTLLPVCSCRPDDMPPEVDSWMVSVKVTNREQVVTGE